MTRDYEVIFIFNTQEKIYHATLEKVKNLLEEKKVKVTSEDDMGVKTLAYEIKKNKKGHYYLFNLETDSLVIKELTNELKLYEELLKYMFVKKEIKYFRKTGKKGK